MKATTNGGVSRKGPPATSVVFRAGSKAQNRPPIPVQKGKQRGTTPADKALGARIRLRRVEQKMSQAELGDKLGVTFQQVQKYEKGVNRVGASRLQSIATALDVPVTFFYDGDGRQRQVESLLFLDSSFSLRLLRAYSKIKDQNVQRHFVTLMESLAGED